MTYYVQVTDRENKLLPVENKGENKFQLTEECEVALQELKKAPGLGATSLQTKRSWNTALILGNNIRRSQLGYDQSGK